MSEALIEQRPLRTLVILFQRIVVGPRESLAPTTEVMFRYDGEEIVLSLSPDSKYRKGPVARKLCFAGS